MNEKTESLKAIVTGALMCFEPRQDSKVDANSIIELLNWMLEEINDLLRQHPMNNETEYIEEISRLRKLNKKLHLGLSSILHSLYAIQNLLHENPLVKVRSTDLLIIDSGITRASDLLKESET